MSARVSVALATYNGAAFLPEQLRSLAEQTRPPDELVVSDDGSTDATLDVVREFGRAAPFPVRVLDKPARLGFSDNFLHAAENCAHEIVAFCDQDDAWLPRKLEIGGERLRRDGSLLAMHRLTLTDAALRPTGVLDQGIAGDAVFEPLELSPSFTVWGNSLMFRRELIGLIPREQRPRQPGFDRPLSHDHWVHVLAAALGRVSHIAEPLILYRQHGGNAMGIERETATDRLAKLLADPTAALRSEARFDADMGVLLSDLARRADVSLAGSARAAATRFAERERYLRHRANAYSAPTFLSRARGLLAAISHSPHDPAVMKRRYRAAAKDFAIGVTGLSRRHRAARRRADITDGAPSRGP